MLIFPPAAVQEVKVAPLNATAVNVSWDGVPTSHTVSIDHYTVAYRQVSQSRQNSTHTLQQHAVISGIGSSINYEFQVFAAYVVNGTHVDGEISTPLQFTSFGEFIYCMSEV